MLLIKGEMRNRSPNNKSKRHMRGRNSALSNIFIWIFVGFFLISRDVRKITKFIRDGKRIAIFKTKAKERFGKKCKRLLNNDEI